MAVSQGSVAGNLLLAEIEPVHHVVRGIGQRLRKLSSRVGGTPRRTQEPNDHDAENSQGAEKVDDDGPLSDRSRQAKAEIEAGHRQTVELDEAGESQQGSG
jgi:hypothetical protein